MSTLEVCKNQFFSLKRHSFTMLVLKNNTIQNKHLTRQVCARNQEIYFFFVGERTSSLDLLRLQIYYVEITPKIFLIKILALQILLKAGKRNTASKFALKWWGHSFKKLFTAEIPEYLCSINLKKELELKFSVQTNSLVKVL